ncbi:hypothetical protein H2203_001949 [Taxawa tesnikishii (nom. ined.)]|nr:hypothetical protein H2203_001949 [Dothideales sp. JES 119]
MSDKQEENRPLDYLLKLNERSRAEANIRNNTIMLMSQHYLRAGMYAKDEEQGPRFTDSVRPKHVFDDQITIVRMMTPPQQEVLQDLLKEATKMEAHSRETFEDCVSRAFSSRRFGIERLQYHVIASLADHENPGWLTRMDQMDMAMDQRDELAANTLSGDVQLNESSIAGAVPSSANREDRNVGGSDQAGDGSDGSGVGEIKKTFWKQIREVGLKDKPWWDKRKTLTRKAESV